MLGSKGSPFCASGVVWSGLGSKRGKTGEKRMLCTRGPKTSWCTAIGFWYILSYVSLVLMSTWTKCRTIVLQKPKINDWSWSAGHTSYFYVQVPDKCPAKPSVIDTSRNDWSQKCTGVFRTYTEFYVGFNHWKMGQGLQDNCPALSRALFWASSHQEVKKLNPPTHPPISSPPMGWSLTGTRTTHEHNNAILTPKIPMRLRIDFDLYKEATFGPSSVSNGHWDQK